MRRLPKLLLPLISLFVALCIVYAHINSDVHLSTPQTDAPGGLYKVHILGGFSVDTPERAAKAAADSIQVVFGYGQPPSERDELGQKLAALHMRVIDGFISSYLFYYECHRTKAVLPHHVGQEQFCQVDEDPGLTNEHVLLGAIADHLKQAKSNPLMMGYWVLDDWVSWDAGSARQILIKIHELIQEYTPGRPAICGFGGSVTANTTSGWSDRTADNFSPKGCDMVGLYLYASSPPDVYDWSMSAVLPAMFASLQRRGWNITSEPLIGIGQAFGGPMANAAGNVVIPSARDIETQSKSFCKHGATGLAFLPGIHRCMVREPKLR